MIKKLVLRNFKSYKEEVIVFRSNFSAIIGPNGSGKSNIMDAICFVLGIESAAMRATALQDLIHREAQGPCSVSLVLEAQPQQEGDENEPPAGAASEGEFTFERSVVRKGKSGEATSVYKVNGKTVNADVYRDQLERLRVMTRANSFLVFQGDVASVGSASNSVQLTKLFEQVSGSAELEKRYEQLRVEKERAEENNVLHFRKKRGMDAEKRQMEDQEAEAAQYRELLSRQHTLRQEQTMLELGYVNGQIATQRQNHADAIVAADEARAAVKAAEKDLAEAQKALGAAKRQRLQKDNAFAAKLKEHMKLNPQVIDLRKESEHLTRKLELAKEQERTLQGEAQSQQDELRALEEQLHNIQRMRQDWEEQVRRQSLSDRVAFDEKQLERYNTLKEEANRASVDDRNRVLELQTRLMVKDEEYTALAAKDDALRRRSDDLKDDMRVLQARIKQQRDVVEDAKARVEELRQQMDEDERRVAEATRDRDQATEALAKVQEQLRDEKLERKQSDKERRFLEALDSLKRLYPSVRGRLVSLVEPRQEKFRVATAVAMGRFMDAVVVDDRQTAIECMQYLKTQKVGVATFLPLDSVQTKDVQARLRANATLVADVLVFDKAIEKAVWYAVGNTLVSEGTDQEARQLAFGGQERHKVVTLNGTVFHKSGMITGGAASAAAKGAAKKWTATKLDGLKKARDDLLERLDRAGRELRDRSDGEAKKEEIATLEARIAAVSADVAHLEGKIATLQQELATVERAIQTVGPALSTARQDVDALRAQVKSSEDAVHVAEDRVFAAFCRQVGVDSIRQYEREAVTIAKQRNEQRLKLAAQEARITASLSYGRSRDLDAPRKALSDQLKADAKQLKAVDSKLKDLSKKEEALLKELEALKGEVAALKKKETDAQNNVKASRKVATDASAAELEHQKKAAEMEGSLRTLQSRRHAVLRRATVEEVRLPMQGGEEMAAGDFFREAEGSQSQVEVFDAEDELQFDFSGLRDELQDVSSEADFERLNANVQAELQAVTLDLSKMNPNLKVEEKLREFKGKVREMKDEIKEARQKGQTAEQAFKEIREERLRLFMSCFKFVQERIEDVYGSLTRPTAPSASGAILPGGKAFLTLQNANEPWDGGITYQAIPPSKRLWSFDQLSGGERSLASLALLFALQSWRPAPFFVLDEVDAALDGNNVDRVVRYVQEASNNWQFIIISLKDAFFSQADALIGVYKDNKGDCSRTLSIDLAGREYAQ